MRRWLWYFALVPQLFLVAAWLEGLGLPHLDLAALLVVFGVLFAARPTLPWLVLGGAIGRALVDDGALPVQILVLGVPLALLLPLRAWLPPQRWLWQVMLAALAATMVWYADAVCARWFVAAGGSGVWSVGWPGWRIGLAGLWLPLALAVLRRVPPLAGLAEERG